MPGKGWTNPTFRRPGVLKSVGGTLSMCATPLGTRSGTMKPSAIARPRHLGRFQPLVASRRRSRCASAGRLLRRGVTLIELLIALAITMIMMTAVITLFANLSGTVTDSRALIEISERLRATRNRLQLDLAGHTATTLPPLRPEDGEGYLEIIEGPNSDAGSYIASTAPPGSLLQQRRRSQPGQRHDRSSYAAVPTAPHPRTTSWATPTMC